MNLIYGITQVMHRIRVKLYPSYLPGCENTFIARTNCESNLNVEQVCAALRDRGGFTGNFNDLLEYVKQYNNEAAYQLCDGFAVSNGYYTIYPNLGGVFQTPHETPDPQKHPLSFRFRTLDALRKLAGSINIEVEGLADSNGYIDEFIDKDEDAVNSVFAHGNGYVINGHKIKLAGDDPAVGVYLVPVNDPSKAVRMTRIFENSSSRIIGIAASTGYLYNKVEIRTQYAGSSGILLKNPRTITSSFILEET
ncbi:MAG: DUF4469 domain-containing protein [Treponema sp.]|nr:DUF4469 domain-containing protein [Treponema sp.]